MDEQAALAALDIFAERWEKKYPKISQFWRDNWPNLSTYFKFPQELRRLIYTTNPIEGFNRQLRRVTKRVNARRLGAAALNMRSVSCLYWDNGGRQLLPCHNPYFCPVLHRLFGLYTEFGNTTLFLQYSSGICARREV